MSTRLSRIIIKRHLMPFIPSFITPNHVTTIRLLLSLQAAWLLTLGTRDGFFWGGLIFFIAVFCDRIDGVIARERQQTSITGHYYDVIIDALANGLFFIAIGYSTTLKNGMMLGIIAALGIIASTLLAQLTNPLIEEGHIAYQGDWFDADDTAYFFGFFPIFALQDSLLIAAAYGAPIFALYAGGRFLILKARKR